MPHDLRHTLTDAERLDAWVREHGPAVRGFLWASLRSEHLADELLQEVFCRAWQARSRYVDAGRDRSYLLTIADRLVCDRGRKAGREVDLNEAGWTGVEPRFEQDPAAGLLQGESVEQMTEALKTLSEPQQRVLLLRFYGDFPFQEIARMTGWPLNTVLSHSRRGLLALRALLIEDPA